MDTLCKKKSIDICYRFVLFAHLCEKVNLHIGLLYS